jgi:predicted glutamine amidotransferase
MCRLFALTTTNLDPTMRRLFWHQLALASNADGQPHGTGMSDGTLIAKSHLPFVNYGTNWASILKPDAIWLGHVRAASQHTGRTMHEAHPFVFKLDNGSYLHAAHNGGITGMSEPEKDEPKVDSYQAFKLLVALLNKNKAELTQAVIDTWTSDFGIGSQWTFMLHYQGRLTVLRGVRTMYYMQLGNGLMFNTSHEVLLHVKEWINTYWYNKYVLGRIEEIKEYQMGTFDKASVAVKLVSLAKPAVTSIIDDTYYQWDGASERILKR